MPQLAAAMRWMIEHHVSTYLLGLVAFLALKPRPIWWLEQKAPDLNVVLGLIVASLIVVSGIVADKGSSKMPQRAAAGGASDTQASGSSKTARDERSLPQLKDAAKDLAGS